VEREKTQRAAIELQASQMTPRRAAMLSSLSQPGIHVIAECKRRSPSKGVLRQSYDPVAIARGYEQAGAAAISVLTEPAFFDGSADHLLAVRAAVELPLLRKDFLVNEFQIVESRALGADAVLLIVAALTDRQLKTLMTAAAAHDLAALVEVHSVDEARRAVDLGATLIGVNSRDLRTLQVSLAVFDEVATALPSGILAVAESGISNAADIARLRRHGYNAFLMGERFMTAPDPGAALGALLAEARVGDRA